MKQISDSKFHRDNRPSNGDSNRGCGTVLIDNSQTVIIHGDSNMNTGPVAPQGVNQAIYAQQDLFLASSQDNTITETSQLPNTSPFRLPNQIEESNFRTQANNSKSGPVTKRSYLNFEKFQYHFGGNKAKKKQVLKSRGNLDIAFSKLNKNEMSLEESL